MCLLNICRTSDEGTISARENFEINQTKAIGRPEKSWKKTLRYEKREFAELTEKYGVSETAGYSRYKTSQATTPPCGRGSEQTSANYIWDFHFRENPLDFSNHCLILFLSLMRQFSFSRRFLNSFGNDLYVPDDSAIIPFFSQVFYGFFEENGYHKNK